MHCSVYEDYYDVGLPDGWRELLGERGAFVGVNGPKAKPIINYGVPEYQAAVAALWHFGQLPFFTQLCVLDEQTRGN